MSDIKANLFHSPEELLFFTWFFWALGNAGQSKQTHTSKFSPGKKKSH